MTNNALNTEMPITVPDGGSGAASFSVPYGVLCAGTTTTANLQNISALGDANYVLTSNGAAALPTFQVSPGASAAWEHVSNTTISSDASIDIIGLSASYCYMIECERVIPETDSTDLNMRTSTDNGSSFDAGGNYGYALQSVSHNNTITTDTSTIGANQGVLNTLGLGDTAGEEFYCRIFLYNVTTSGTTCIDFVSSYADYDNSVPVSCTGMIYKSATEAVDAVQLKMSADDLATGTVRLYRLALS